ncbi:hypothetical protein TNCV_4940341 [Trichonephila clavipes]|nr:hypothetical protein TNCV_4940341 [Trichonephila clavipes]
MYDAQIELRTSLYSSKTTIEDSSLQTAYEKLSADFFKLILGSGRRSTDPLGTGGSTFIIIKWLCPAYPDSCRPLQAPGPWVPTLSAQWINRH